MNLFRSFLSITMNEYMNHYVVRDNESYIVDELFQTKDLLIYTYIDPNGVNVLVGLSVNRTGTYFNCIFTREYSVVILKEIDDDTEVDSVETLPSLNNIKIHRDQTGEVIRILACDGIHSLRDTNILFETENYSHS